METLVLDTSAIFNFGHRGQLEFLLKKLTKQHRFVTTPVVVKECERGAVAMDQANAKADDAKPKLKEIYTKFIPANFEILSHESAAIPDADLKRLADVIHPGEISVMMLALELKATAVIDDKLARREAVQLKIEIMGTLGLVEKGRARGWMTDHQCLEIVERLRAAKFRLNPPPGANDTFAEYFSRFEKT
jgi:predicted nucleic acid-binding protein